MAHHKEEQCPHGLLLTQGNIKDARLCTQQIASRMHDCCRSVNSETRVIPTIEITEKKLTTAGIKL